MRLSNEFNNFTRYKHNPLRRMWIAKTNGEEHSLGISTIKDRIIQSMIRFSLKTAYKSYTSSESFGLRIGRSRLDL